ncbi:MAG: DUF6089 family protein [Prevotellaceae bacterium]|nr:DUF6089 family protein [Prevotellaceae bacterium]
MNIKKSFPIVLLPVMFMLTVPSSAQRYKTYYLELGILGGGSYYLGDVNNTLLNNMLTTAGAFFKYRFNNRWELKFQVSGGQTGIAVFDESMRRTTFVDGAVIGEFNFFNYGATPFNPHTYNITPYIFAGLGFSTFHLDVGGVVPFGVGVKWRIAQRFNLGAYWSSQKVIWNDNFDGIDNPLGLNQGGWNNTDWYSTVAMYFSVDLWERCAPCAGPPKHVYNR